MKYDFDKVVDRHGTNCLKYDFAIERGKPADILPLFTLTPAPDPQSDHPHFQYRQTDVKMSP